MSMTLFRLYRSHPTSLALVITFTLVTLWYFRSGIQSAWAIACLPITWSRSSSDFMISKDKDGFDLTFANYSLGMQSSLPDYPDQVPPVLHHIALGHDQPQSQWLDARQSCLDYHSGWESHLWTDENAPRFVLAHFPQFKSMWDSYKYPIQRIDALRYMVLYEYGGIVLDMDLKCRRSLGPLRRFGFVAPAAHPTGFSIGFMMASRQHPFVAELVRNLAVYNHHWFGLPYPTVMFSTGCHFASSIHTLQENRAELKILAGPKENPKLHRLNGDVVTPLFYHLGTSSWHSFDASLIVSLGKSTRLRLYVCMGFILGLAVLVAVRLQVKDILRRHRLYGWILHGEKTPPAEFDSRIA